MKSKVDFREASDPRCIAKLTCMSNVKLLKNDPENSKRRWQILLLIPLPSFSFFFMIITYFFSISWLRFVTSSSECCLLLKWCVSWFLIKGKRCCRPGLLQHWEKRERLGTRDRTGDESILIWLLIFFPPWIVGLCLWHICVIWNSRWDFQRNPNLIPKG